MDQLLSQVLPTQKIGNDGFNWWVGQIEKKASDDKKNKGGYRFQVRIVGDHPESKDLLRTDDLPWANVMMPVNVPFMPGNTGGASCGLDEGCWVVGFYLDSDKQKPLIIGSIGQTPGATTVTKVQRPDEDKKAFQTVTSTTKNPSYPPTDGTPAAENPNGGPDAEVNKVTGALSDGACNEDGTEKVPTPDRRTKSIAEETWCQEVAEKCTKDRTNERLTFYIGEFLAEVQNNNGNIGDYLVGQVNGKINSAVDIGRKYVNKAMTVIREFIARVKGFVIEKITAGVKDLIKIMLGVNKNGNTLTPVTEWFNELLKDLGCQMEDLGKRLEKWLTDVLMSYINQVYQAAACLLDTLVEGILSKVESLLEDVLASVLGPLQDIIGAAALPLNIIGGAIDYALELLGISCSGPTDECADYKVVCTDGEKKKPGDDKDFLDDLLAGIDNLFPVTGADYNQYTCADAYQGTSLSDTTLGFTGGVPASTNTPTTPSTKKEKITYSIQDIEVEEGVKAQFIVTRTGYTDYASSVKYKTLTNKGTAKEKTDYIPAEGILGFAAGETEKVINIQTLYSEESEQDEYFFIKLTMNSPGEGSGIKTYFSKNIGKCTITETDLTKPYNPAKTKPIDPTTAIEEVFPPDTGTGDGETGDGETGDGGVDTTTPSYTITPDKTIVKEGEFISYIITTTNVENGTILYYTLTGSGITSGDIIGSSLTGNLVINNGTGKAVVGIEDDGVVEDEEILRFTLNGTGVFADVLITTADDDTGPDDLGDFDEGEGDTPENTYSEFQTPTVDPTKIITDDNGGIIEIPIENPGDAWAEPPYVWIGGEGIGAIATPLLDQNGFITEIRVKSTGYGYKLNTSTEAGVRCIIDTFTIISPGRGYTSKPDIYVNGEKGIAEAIINDDGFVIGARTLNRELTFEKMPEILVIGGGGYGATMIPSLVCLDTDGLSRVGSTKIGTGRYVDCP